MQTLVLTLTRCTLYLLKLLLRQRNQSGHERLLRCFVSFGLRGRSLVRPLISSRMLLMLAVFSMTMLATSSAHDRVVLLGLILFLTAHILIFLVLLAMLLLVILLLLSLVLSASLAGSLLVLPAR